MKKLMMTLAAVFCCAALFTSCDKNEKDAASDVGYTYDFSVSVPDSAEDQLAVVKTVIKAPDSQGVMQDHELTKYLDEIGVKTGVPNKDLSKPLTLIVEQTLLPNYPVKDSYKMGLDYKLEVTSTDSNGRVLDQQKKTETDRNYTVRAENLSKSFPSTMTFTVTVAANGNINIDRK